HDNYSVLLIHPHITQPNTLTLHDALPIFKIPGTPEGLPAIQQLISEGININITLLFSQKVYVQVTEAYLAGLEQLAASGGDVSKDRKSTRLNSSHQIISYAVFCLKKKKI